MTTIETRCPIVDPHYCTVATFTVEVRGVHYEYHFRHAGDAPAVLQERMRQCASRYAVAEMRKEKDVAGAARELRGLVREIWE